MNPVLVLGAAGAATWVLRVAFITLLPARKLPQRVREALEAGAPAAMAALLTSELLQTGAHDGSLVPAGLATGVAALVTWRWENLAVTAAAGIAAYWAAMALLY